MLNLIVIFRVNFMSRTGMESWCRLSFPPRFKTAPGMGLDQVVLLSLTFLVSSVLMEEKVCQNFIRPVASSHRNCCIPVLGFLCGQCPEEQGVDFTLRQCKKCTDQDAVFVTAFCKLIVVVH